MTEPAAPPAAASREKARVKMDANTGPIMEMLEKKMTTEPTMYRMTMKGTIFSVTEAMRFKPPSTTSPARMTTAMPVTQVGMPNTSCMLPEMELIWVILPMPKEARKQNTENSTASTRPMVLQPFLAPRPSRR